MERLRVTKNVKEIKFEVVWGKLELKTDFQRQSVKNFETNYFSLEIAHCRKS